MRYVSLFSGVEAATVAWEKLGWQPLAFAEVDPFPCAVLAHRFPYVPNLGDVCGIDWEEFYEKHGAVDVLIGGSPCQSFSIAGGREGLEGESRLMFEYIRAVRDLVRVSEGRAPRYIVWENVPGCLSSNKGRDFECLLDELEKCGYFLEWRTLDSQFARVFDRSSGRFRGPVPQRRRRVYLVGCLGGPSAANILIERTSLRGDHPKSRAAREALAEHPEGSPGMGDCAGFKWFAGARAKGIGYEEGTSPTITNSDGHIPAITAGFCQGNSKGAGSIGFQQEMSPTLRAGESGTNQVPAVLTPWDVQSKRVNMPHGTSPSLQSGTGEGMNIQPIVLTTANTKANGSNVSEDGVAYTIDLANSNAVCVQGNIVDRENGGADGNGARDDGASYTLTANDRHVVAFAQNNRREVRLFGGDGQTCGALAANPDFGKGQGGSIICMADDNGKCAVDEDMCGSLKVGGGQPMIARRTEAT